MISSADLAHYGVSRAKHWVSVNCGTINVYSGGRVPVFAVVFFVFQSRICRVTDSVIL